MHVALHPVLPLRIEPLTERRGVNRELLLLILLVVLDSLAFACAYIDLLQIRAAGVPEAGPLLVSLASIGVVFVATGRYSLRGDMSGVDFAAEHGFACLIACALTLLLQFAIFFDVSTSRLAFFAAYVLFTPMSLVFRRVIGRAVRLHAAMRTIVVIGAGAEAVHFRCTCRMQGLVQNLRFVDFSDTANGGYLDGFDLPMIAEEEGEDFGALLDKSVEAIVLAKPLPRLSAVGIEAMVRTHFHHAPILTLEAFHEQYWKKIPVATMDPIWPLRQDFRLARNSSYCLFKRAFDIGMAGVGFFVTAPLLIACAIALRLEENAPILYRQNRICRDRQRFTLYKFRTMQPGGDSAELYTRDRDARVTRVGRWLRRMRLDELPQLWNVLKGDMSLVGPRAEWDRCVEIYEREIPCYHFRHLVKPGITGWAQVNYPYGRSVEDTVEKLKFDLYYIKNYSLMLDASIVLKTLYVMLSFKGK